MRFYWSRRVQVGVALSLLFLILTIVGLVVVEESVDEYSSVEEVLVDGAVVGDERAGEQDRRVSCSVDFVDLEVLKFAGEPGDLSISRFFEAQESIQLLSEDVGDVNFAGQYRVVTESCGTECEAAHIVHVPSGELVVYGLQSRTGFLFDVSSTVFQVNSIASEYEANEGFDPYFVEYYAAGNSALDFVCAEEIGANEDEMCIQVLKEASNPATGETILFSTPCDVPEVNWK